MECEWEIFLENTAIYISFSQQMHYIALLIPIAANNLFIWHISPKTHFIILISMVGTISQMIQACLLKFCEYSGNNVKFIDRNMKFFGLD